MKHAVFLPALVAIFATLAARATGLPDATVLDPFEITYSVTYKGVPAGESVFRLSRNADGTIEYSAKSRARSVFRVFIPQVVRQDARMELAPDGVRPLRFASDDGTAKTARDIDLTYDWVNARVSGWQEGQAIDLPLAGNVQDAMSAQIALMLDRSQGRLARDYLMAGKSGLQTYLYRSLGSEQLETSVGPLQAEVFESRRSGAKHAVRVWLAPALGFLPVQAEQRREDARVWIMQVQRVQGRGRDSQRQPRD